MRLGIATDHGGFGLKEELLRKLRKAAHKVVDVGAYAMDPADDYLDFVEFNCSHAKGYKGLNKSLGPRPSTLSVGFAPLDTRPSTLYTCL